MTPQHNPVALICQFHQLEAEPIAWAAETGGSVVEFHLHALDGPLATAPDNEVWNHIRPTVLEVIPERATAHVVGFTIGNYENFSSFATGMGEVRLFCDSFEADGIANPCLCGDWIRSPQPQP